MASPVKDQLTTTLSNAFTPEHLDIQDDSHKHAGHAGARPEGETHFRVTVVSETFKGQNRVARQRAVYSVIEALTDGPIHALQLFTYTPAEWAQKIS